MIKKGCVILMLSMAFWGLANCSVAQFLTFELEIEPELSATTQKKLNFGVQMPEAGNLQVNLGDENMGVFRLKGLVNQRILVLIDTPKYLTHADPSVNSRIPVEIFASYNNTGIDNAFNSVPFNGKTAFFTLHSTENQNSRNLWTSSYIYIYGNLALRNVETGLYTGEIVLTVEHL